MTDIVERLRTGFDWNDSASNVASLIQYGDLTDEAADKIERLEKELAASQAREAKLREALDATLGCVDVYYIPALKDEFALADAPQDDTALKEYRKKVLLGAADVLEEKGYSTEDGHLHSEYHAAEELRKMAED